MSLINAYLRQVAEDALVSSSEQNRIERSISALSSRLADAFEEGVILKGSVFGSYSRQTMLPRWIDDGSDVDYMVVFSDRSKQPQTYLDNLKAFIAENYKRSEFFQDHPTVSVNLKHIRLELVPAISAFWGGLQIPTKGEYLKWISTDPDAFSASLDEVDRYHNGLIRPLVRLAKYWNTRSGHVFDSFELEKKIVSHGFAWVPKTLEAYFFEFMSGLNVPYSDAQWRKDRIASLKKELVDVKKLKGSLNSGEAVIRLARMIPPKYGVIFPDMDSLLANWPVC